MADVAARARVSRALVSTVFRDVPGASPVTRERVLKAAADLGYQVDNRARMLRRSRTRMLGVVFQIQDAFHSDLVEAMYPVAEAANYDLVLSAATARRPERDAAEQLLRDRCEALVFVGPQIPEAQLADLAARVPTIVTSRRVTHPDIDLVMTADKEVVDMALGHLASIGHTNIAHLDGARILGAVERRRWYRNIMKQRNLGEFIQILEGGNTEVEGIRAAAALARDKAVLPSAVVCFNDSVAVGFMFGLRQAGVRVPEDVSVVGYDDIHMAGLPFVSLSTVGQDVTATAKGAIDHALGRLDRGARPGVTWVPPYLVQRSTTFPARQQALLPG
jgi:DNA-binding LacI/PurR family transcriptional regulator